MTEKRFTVKEVLEILLRDCDGAQSEDGVGFNKFDSVFARDLSSRSEWTYKQEYTAYKMLRKYRNQLKENHGIEYSKIKIENESPQKKGEKRIVKYIGSGDLAVEFDYKQELVSAVKDISGRSWDSKNKRWLVPINSTTIPELRNFVGKYDFDVSDKAVEEINKRKGKKYKRITIKNDKIIIKFPYNTRLVSEVKRITGRKWNNDKKRWELPINSDTCREAVKFGRNYGFDISDEIGERCQKLEEDVELSLAENADIEVDNFGDNNLKLKTFQRAGVKYASEKKRTFIADEMGLGKTIESLATVQNLDSYPLLVVCPATLKLNWEIEVNKWLKGKEVTLIEGRENKNLEKADIYIINYDILHNNLEGLLEIQFESIIFDESHKIKNHKAKRSKAAEEIVKELDIPVRLLLTGTPIKNRPKELIHQLNVLDRIDDLGGFWNFARRYCNAHKTRFGTDMNGASNLNELNKRLREKCYVRREKSEVLGELPDKVRTDIHLEIDNREEYNSAKYDIIRWIEENEGEEKAFKASKAETLVKLNKLKRITSEGKKSSVIEWVNDFLESGEKLVLFAHHIDLIKSLRDRFGALSIYGETSMKEKQKAVEKFQNNPDEQLIVISLQAGSEGITLTSASNVAFAELGWSPAEHDQAEDRCHRIGQKSSVNAWYLIAENTIDELIRELIEEKRRIFKKSVNGSGISSGPEDIVDEVISRLKLD